METSTPTIPTMMDLWQLLQPSLTYDTRGRFEKCRQDWHSMDEAQQQRVYGIIEQQISSGVGVNPNPYYALNDAMQQDEQQQAKCNKSERIAPKNYDRSRDFDEMVKTGTLVTAEYQGQVGIYTEADATKHHMRIIKHLQA